MWTKVRQWKRLESWSPFGEFAGKSAGFVVCFLCRAIDYIRLATSLLFERPICVDSRSLELLRNCSWKPLGPKKSTHCPVGSSSNLFSCTRRPQCEINMRGHQMDRFPCKCWLRFRRADVVHGCRWMLVVSWVHLSGHSKSTTASRNRPHSPGT